MTLLYLMHAIWHVTILSFGAVETFSSGARDEEIRFTESGPVHMQGKSNQIIENLLIRDAPGNAIEIRDCNNITVRNCKILNARGEAVSIYNTSGVEVRDCYFENVRTGVYAVSSRGVKVRHNECKNVRGPMPRGQMVQFDKVSGPGNEISYNFALNDPKNSNPEDVINLFLSGGTETEPLIVMNNFITGGGPSESGGGIMCGDGGDRSEYIRVLSNVLVNPGQYGIAVVSGRHITVEGNLVHSRRQPWSNVGIYCWSEKAKFFEHVHVRDNDVYWINKSGSANHGWLAPDVQGRVTGWNTNRFGRLIPLISLKAPAECGIKSWKGPLTSEEVSVTPGKTP
jgi:hypothetical protein